jgi:hypothetical protein
MLWGALFISIGGIDGDKEHIIYENCKPVIFTTKKECKTWIDKKYGYIKTRKDLKSFPHGWRLPKPTKIYLTYTSYIRNR